MNKSSKKQLDFNVIHLSMKGLRRTFSINGTSASLLIALYYICISLPLSLYGNRIQTDLVHNWMFAVGLAGVSGFLNLVAIEITMASHKKRRLSFTAALSEALADFIPYLGLLIVYIALVGLGLLAFVLPGIVFAFWYSLIFFVQMSDRSTIGKAFVKSRTLVRGRFIEFVALTSLGFVLSLFGTFGPLLPIAILTQWFMQLREDVNKPSRTPVHASAYVAAALGLLIVVSVSLMIT